MGPARVRFVADYIYTPSAERRVSTKFRAGQAPQLVNGECAARAIAAGAAELVAEIPAPSGRVRKARKARTAGKSAKVAP